MRGGEGSAGGGCCRRVRVQSKATLVAAGGPDGRDWRRVPPTQMMSIYVLVMRLIRGEMRWVGVRPTRRRCDTICAGWRDRMADTRVSLRGCRCAGGGGVEVAGWG